MPIGRAFVNELLSNTLACLSLHDLTSASLVSKSWQATAFPHLYRTLCLTLAPHLELIAERIASNAGGQLSIRSHVRELILDENYNKIVSDVGEPIAEEDLEHLAAILPKLTRLEHFSWGMSFIPRNSEVVEALQTGCPNLNSIHLAVNEDPDTLELFDDDYLSLFKFKNLLHFALTIKHLPLDYDEDHLDSLVNLLRTCPDLKSLSLDLRDWDDGGYTWSPDTLFRALDTTTFSSLQSFRALGKATPDWTDFFSPPDYSPLRLFLSRHSSLNAVSIGWVDECAYNQNIDPQTMAGLLPSLKHLEAPAFFCGPVLASSLADKLETVGVLDGRFDSTGPNLNTIAEGVAPLPKLRKLALHAEDSDPIEVEPLKILLSAAPALEELELRIPLDEPDQLLELLKLLPNIRTLGICPPVLSSLQTDLGVPEWQECIPTLAETCPLLRCINNLSAGDDDPYWLIKPDASGASGKVEVSQSVTP